MSEGAGMNDLGHLKRPSFFDAEDPTGKKPKVTALLVENSEKRETLDMHVSGENNPALVKENGHKKFSSRENVPQKSRENSSMEDVFCDSGTLNQCINELSIIEADAAEDKGSRHSMEDAWVVLPDASMEFSGTLRCAHFAIYDGHGGRLAAEFAQKHLHRNVLSAGLPRELMDIKAAKKAILEGFQRTDEFLLRESAAGGWQDGATAVCLWVLGQTVLVANIGDAKAVLARLSPTGGSSDIPEEPSATLKPIVITREHKAIYPKERARIQKAGGSVGTNGRLQGRLEVSRAFGDRQFKKVGVIATPDVYSFDLTGREKFIILGCDGFWGVFGPSDAVDFIHKHLQDGLSATTIVRRLVREAVRERRCKDNCTAILVVFKNR